MTAPIRWNNFAAGEIDPKIYERNDLDRAVSGVRKLVNMFPTAQGSAVKRPGSELIGRHPYQDEKARLIPFQFNITQQYVLVLQESGFSVLKDGGLVTIPDTDATQYPLGEKEASLTTIEFDAGGFVTIDTSGTTATNHGLSAGDVVFLGEQPANFEVASFRFFTVSSSGITATTFRLAELGGALFDPETTQAATANAPYAPVYTEGALPFTEDDLFDGALDYAQSTDDLYLVHWDYQPRLLTRTDHHVWTASLFSASPEEPAVANLTHTASGAGSLTIKWGVTAINDDTAEESLVAEYTLTSVADPSTTNVTLQWDYQSSATKYRVYKAVNGVFGLLAEARWTSGSTVSYTDDGTRVPLLEIGPPIEVRNEFDTANNYPRAVALFQQRIWFGGTKNAVNGLYSSRSGSFQSFAVEEVTVDSSPIAQVIAAEGVHEVRYLLARKDLVVMTAEGEWMFDKGELGIITPSSGLLDEGDHGVANVKPLKAGKSVLFVESTGRIVRDLAYELQADGVDGIELTAAAEHIFEGKTIVDWCFAKKPYRLVFCVLSDGTAATLTYDKEQQIAGWARHDVAGQIESCASIREGDVDNIYITVKRGATEQRTIERLNMNETTSSAEGRYLDCWSRVDPTDQYWKLMSAFEFVNDGSDDWKVKIQLADVDAPEEYWPCTLVPTAYTTRLFPWLGSNDETFVLTETTAPTLYGDTAGLTWYQLNRWSGGHPTWSTKATDEGNMTLYPVVDPPDDLENGREKITLTGPALVYFSTAEYDYLPELVDGFNSTNNSDVAPIFKIDDEVARAGDGSYTVATNRYTFVKAYANVIRGYPFAAELETSEPSSAESPFDGSNVRAPEVTFGIHQAGPFKYKRMGSNIAPTRVDPLTDRSYVDYRYWLFQKGKLRKPLLSVWDPRSSILIQSDEPFPLTVSSIKIEAEVGRA